MTGDWGGVREAFEGFVHEKLYDLRPYMIEAAFSRTEHSLGKLRPEIEEYANAKNFSPPVPFVYVFHLLLEENGRVPLWQDVVTFVHKTRPDLLLEPYFKEHGLRRGSPEASEGSDYMSAFQYRVGKAYYSWFREIHLLTALRCKHRLDVRYHFLVDAEWKADFVAGDVLVEVFIENRFFKNASGNGRKQACRTANPGVDVIDIPLKPRKAFGMPWLVADASIDELVSEMRQRGCPRIA